MAMNSINSEWIPCGLRWRRAVLSIIPGTAGNGRADVRLLNAKAFYEDGHHAQASVQERIDSALKLYKECGVQIKHEWSKVRPA